MAVPPEAAVCSAGSGTSREKKTQFTIIIAFNCRLRTVTKRNGNGCLHLIRGWTKGDDVRGDEGVVCLLAIKPGAPWQVLCRQAGS